MTHALRLTTVAAISLGAAACASIAPGDYAVYRIGFSETELGSDCYDGEDPPPDIIDDESTFYAGGTFVIFRGADDGYVLDAQEGLLTGTRDSGEYVFRGRASDVYYQGDDRYEDRLDVTIRLTDKGDRVEGSSTTIDEQICSGIDCAVGYDGTCTQRTGFIGTRVKDADIEYVIAAD